METYAEFVKDKIDFKADFAVIIGSGLASILDSVQIVKKISYQEIPHYPVSTVAGHAGELIFGISMLLILFTL